MDSLDEMYLGVYEKLLYARKTKPVEGKFFVVFDDTRSLFNGFSVGCHSVFMFYNISSWFSFM